MSILRFDFSARLLHWSHAVVFVWLLITGAQLIFTHKSLLGDPFIKMIHLYVSPLFIILPLLFYYFSTPTTRNDVKELMTWTDYDVRWINDYLRMKKKYVFGKFDAGQKADFFGTVFLITGLSFTGLSFTGFVVWMKSFFSTGFVELNFLAHDIFAVLALLLFIMHILFAVYYRALHGIIFGDVDDEGAQKNYPNWFEMYRS